MRAALVQSGQTLVFLGDSITQDPNGYVSIVAQTLCHRHLDVRVVNAGIGGHKANDMLARLERDVLSHRPDLVAVSAGINDVWHGYYDFANEEARGAFDPSIGLEVGEYERCLGQIVARLSKSGAQVLLIEPTVIGEEPGTRENQALELYCKSMRRVATRNRAALCPMREAFFEAAAKGAKLTTDGVHMTSEGKKLMARQVLRSLGLAAQ